MAKVKLKDGETVIVGGEEYEFRRFGGFGEVSSGLCESGGWSLVRKGGEKDTVVAENTGKTLS